MNNEPVAWMEIEEGGITEYKVWREPVSSKSIPLYTHPAKTLTDEEIDNAITEAFNRGARFGYAEGLKKASEK